MTLIGNPPVATEVGQADHDHTAGGAQADVASALVFERAARPLSQGAGPQEVLRLVDGPLHGLGQEKIGESVGQLEDLPLPSANVLGIADDASVTAELLDLLLDVMDGGLDFRKSTARGLGTLLGLGSPPRLMLRHARSPGAGEIGKRRLSASAGERQIPESTYSFGMLLSSRTTKRGAMHCGRSSSRRHGMSS